jgi:hypothetical protein
MGTLGVDTLAVLKERYDGAAGQGQHGALNPPVGPFEREVADLICRYKDGHKFKSGTVVIQMIRKYNEPNSRRRRSSQASGGLITERNGRKCRSKPD